MCGTVLVWVSSKLEEMGLYQKEHQGQLVELKEAIEAEHMLEETLGQMEEQVSIPR